MSLEAVAKRLALLDPFHSPAFSTLGLKPGQAISKELQLDLDTPSS